MNYLKIVEQIEKKYTAQYLSSIRMDNQCEIELLLGRISSSLEDFKDMSKDLDLNLIRNEYDITFHLDKEVPKNNKHSASVRICILLKKELDKNTYKSLINSLERFMNYFDYGNFTDLG